jgi:transposase-like protein
MRHEQKMALLGIVKELGVSVVQASRDLGVHAKVLREWFSGLHPVPRTPS